nr:uncharacterized protein LOC106684448 isoform X2 [Halyomorpha halys]
MDNLNKVYCKKSEAIHLLQEIDVKSVKNYMHELLSQHNFKKSEFTSKCLICTSSLLKNWQNLVHHLRSPSHVDNIKRNCKQFTAICILCRYILIADDTDFIFEHFTQHKAAIPPLESYRDIDSNKSVEVTASQNCITECSKGGFYPEKAFFSNKTLQLTSLGVSEDEFTISQALSAENIANYCTKTYYSSYYRLRKLYFSCLICKALRLQEKNFYRHLSGFKHNNIVGDCYSTVFIKICDICQVLLLGDMDLTKKHFQCDAHQQNIKCKMGLIKQQYAVMSGVQKLGFSGELTHTCTSFSSKEALNRWVESLLKDAREVASMAVSLCTVLERDIKETLKDKYINFHVKIIGSRLYELANRQSDVDIHLDIGNVSVGFLEEYFYRAGFFQVQRCILDAKVPIIRLKHLESSLICDINTTNPAGPYCSELIKLYISLDERVRWLAIAITEWSAENDIRGARKFKSYALMGLVLFFLMSPNIRLIPSVHELKSLYEGSRVYIKGWDYSFCRDVEKIKKMHNPLLCKLNKYELLAEFFKYYSMHDAKRSVIFPHNGKIYRKVAFANPSKDIYPGVHSNQEDNEPLSIGGRFILIDFFCLRENINKSVDENLFDHFQSICRKTLVCGWQK